MSTSRRKHPPAVVENSVCLPKVRIFLSRVVFFIHAAIGVYSVRSLIKGSELEYFRYISYVLLAFIPIEGIYAIWYQVTPKKWYSPATAIYLVSICSSIILLELHAHDTLAINSWDSHFNTCADKYDEGYCECSDYAFGENGKSETFGAIIPGVWNTKIELDKNLVEIDELINEASSDGTEYENPEYDTDYLSEPGNRAKKSILDNFKPNKILSEITDASSEFKNRFKNITGNINFGSVNMNKLNVHNAAIKKVAALNQQLDNSRLLLHQTLLFVLVICTWIQPQHSRMTQNVLSQLLLIYIALAADIIEFATETIDDDNMNMLCSSKTYYLVWAIWMVSLLQFVLISTASKSPRRGRPGATQQDNNIKVKYELTCCGILENPDLWGMTITLILQDVPYLLARLYMIIFMGLGTNDDGSINQMLIFFTSKNVLTIILQIYRFFIICLDANNDGNITEEDLELIKRKRATQESATV